MKLRDLPEEMKRTNYYSNLVKNGREIIRQPSYRIHITFTRIRRVEIIINIRLPHLLNPLNASLRSNLFSTSSSQQFNPNFRSLVILPSPFLIPPSHCRSPCASTRYIQPVDPARQIWLTSPLVANNSRGIWPLRSRVLVSSISIPRPQTSVFFVIWPWWVYSCIL